MDKSSCIKLIELLTLRPGSFVHQNPVTGEPVCWEAQSLYQYAGWQEGVSQAAFPDSNPIKVRNFQKLLDIPIEAFLVLRYPETNVVELLRFSPIVWQTLLQKEGMEADIISDGKIIASGVIELYDRHGGIRIKKIYCWRNKLHCN